MTWPRRLTAILRRCAAEFPYFWLRVERVGCQMFVGAARLQRRLDLRASAASRSGAQTQASARRSHHKGKSCTLPILGRNIHGLTCRGLTDRRRMAGRIRESTCRYSRMVSGGWWTFSSGRILLAKPRVIFCGISAWAEFHRSGFGSTVNATAGVCALPSSCNRPTLISAINSNRRSGGCSTY